MALFFILTLPIVCGLPLFGNHNDFLEIKCRGSHLFHTPSPECENFLALSNSRTPEHSPLPFTHPTDTTTHAPTTHRPSTTTHPILSAIMGPANTTIFIFPTKTTPPMSVLADWAKALIACISVLSSIYGGLASYFRFHKGWDRRRALSLGLVGGRQTPRTLNIHASSIPLQLRLGAPSSL